MFLCITPSCFAQCGEPIKSSDQNNMDNAIKAYESKKFTNAYTLFKKVAARNPNSPDVNFYLGMIATKRDNKPAAIRKYFTKTIELCPEYENALAHFYMAVIHYTDENYEQAVQELNRYFDLANNSKNPAYEEVYEEASNYLYWSKFLADAELHKAPFQPKVIKGVSSKYDELLPYFTWDKQQAYYLRIVPEDLPPTFYSRQMVDKIPQLMMSEFKNGNYSTGEVLPAPFNQTENEGGVTITADNKLLYYSLIRPTIDGYNNCDIYYSEFRGGVWTDIKPAGRQINNERYWDSQPSITPDGKYLYFASNRPGGVGGIDIWRCKRLPNGDWSRAENLGSRINTPRNEKCPFIHADGHTLYFASNGWQGFGGYDMYFININDNSIARPTNLGLPINTEEDNICFGVTIDGEKAYFSGKMPEYDHVGGSDIFEFDLYPAARPEAMHLITATVTDSAQKPLDAIITVQHYGAEDAEYYVTEGECKFALSCDETNIITVEQDGYMPIIRAITPGYVKNGTYDQQQYILRPLKLNKRYPLNGINYNPTNKELSYKSKKILDAYVQFLQNHPMMHICICSPQNSEARVVYNYLLSKKLRKERLSVGGGSQLEIKIKQL